jgi:hypothetical protein
MSNDDRSQLCLVMIFSCGWYHFIFEETTESLALHIGWHVNVLRKKTICPPPRGNKRTKAWSTVEERRFSAA